MSATNVRIVCPVSSRQIATRSWSGRMGVSVSQPSSWSQSRRAKLSRMEMSWPRAARWSAVGQPQYPPPPKTSTRMDVLPPSRGPGRTRDRPAPTHATSSSAQCQCPQIRRAGPQEPRVQQVFEGDPVQMTLLAIAVPGLAARFEAFRMAGAQALHHVGETLPELQSVAGLVRPMEPVAERRAIEEHDRADDRQAAAELEAGAPDERRVDPARPLERLAANERGLEVHGKAAPEDVPHADPPAVERRRQLGRNDRGRWVAVRPDDAGREHGAPGRMRVEIARELAEAPGEHHVVGAVKRG